MTATQVLNTKLIRATLAEFVGLQSYQSNDIAHQGSWYGNKEVRYLMRWDDWKPDEDLNQMAMVEMKIMADASFSIQYGAKMKAMVNNANGLREFALAATVAAKYRAHVACQLIQEKWQEQ